MSDGASQTKTEIWGQAEVSFVDRRYVDDLRRVEHEAELYKDLALLFAGALISLLGSLLAGVKSPVPLYNFITATTVGGVLCGYFWYRQQGNIKSAEGNLKASKKNSFTLNTTFADSYPAPATSTSSGPATSTSSGPATSTSTSPATSTSK